MRTRITSNARKELRVLQKLRKDGGRKALASAGTSTTFQVRKQAINRWWPRAIKVRRANFMRAALRVARMRSVTLRGSVYDTLKRASISWQTESRTRTPNSSTVIAVPTRFIERKKTAGGKVPARWRPRAPGVYRQGDALYKDTGRGKNKTRTKLYNLKRSVRSPKTYDFYRLADRLSRRLMPRLVAQRIDADMAKIQRTA